MINPTRFCTVLALAAYVLGAAPALAQTSPLQQKVAAIEAAAAKNKEMLGQYTWQQDETISVRGHVKKTALYQVQFDSSGSHR